MLTIQRQMVIRAIKEIQLCPMILLALNLMLSLSSGKYMEKLALYEDRTSCFRTEEILNLVYEFENRVPAEEWVHPGLPRV